ncbi:MAG TPA: hypothetical protein DGO43_00960 [Chloroflexi bacterium]|nr:hypothetical protein [Chloroflexota bacterium]
MNRCGQRVAGYMFRSLMVRHKLCTVMLTVVLGTLLFACGESEAAVPEGPPPDPPGPIDGQLGETVERDGVSITVLRVAATESFGSGVFADDANFFIAIKINVDNTGSAVLNQGLDALVLELSDGTEVKGMYSGPIATLLPVAGPDPGKSSEPGWRSWEVPKGTRSATLSYRPTSGLEIRYAIYPGKVLDRLTQDGEGQAW